MAAPEAPLPLSACIARLLSPEHDLSTADVRSRCVLVRCDLNLPLSRDGAVTDRGRLDAALPLLRDLLERGARVVVASHLGRPKPGVEDDAAMRKRDSLAPVASLLKEALGDAFRGLASDCAGLGACEAVSALRDGKACLLENTRFEPGDVKDDPEARSQPPLAAVGSAALSNSPSQLAKRFASLCDIFVLDGFGVCHRGQASVSGVARCLPASRRFTGPLVRRELQFLGAALDSPRRPFGVVLGGMKVKDKVALLHSLVLKADLMLVGGKMALTFLAATGVQMDACQVESDSLAAARDVLASAAARNVRLLLPTDLVLSSSADGADARVLKLDAGAAVPSGAMALDIGPQTSAAFAEAIAGCATVLWNGPMGRFEVPAFGRGTTAVVDALAKAHGEGAVVVAAGGDSLAALRAGGGEACVSHASTGGGASLQLLEGKSMPGLEALL